MAVQALKDYAFPPADAQDAFHGGQLLYVGWDNHLMFCAPFAYCLPPSTRFAELCQTFLAHSFGYHPDWAKVDFSQATWLKSGQPFVPDMDKTLAEQGLRHKDILRLQTPGLTGIAGSGS
ncbi:phenol hydroxylase [Aquaspirillum sp. LM1]|jgi:phenol hydroxylase P4 protein|uniref:phenol hydroxylase subunit P4 n=1 Tax=Aquaspirillum sp. LM1 TaxID=1938604 RepID=UPI000983F7AC|nr:phenol hydroxylase subunit P4 [Aquaspirillum sp. LM1]AQR66529.1 phenol hydroxylase [Aquaspirillum sp. LM1]